MKNSSGKIGEKLFRIFIITITLILCLVMFYASIKFAYDYFTKTDEQICHDSNSTLINGQCHYEYNTPINDRKNMLLIGAIALPVFAILFIFYLIIILKTKFKEISKNK